MVMLDTPIAEALGVPVDSDPTRYVEAFLRAGTRRVMTGMPPEVAGPLVVLANKTGTVLFGDPRVSVDDRAAWAAREVMLVIPAGWQVLVLDALAPNARISGGPVVEVVRQIDRALREQLERTAMDVMLVWEERGLIVNLDRRR